MFSPTIEKLDEASFDNDENIGHCLLCNREYCITSRDGLEFISTLVFGPSGLPALSWIFSDVTSTAISPK